MIEQAVVDFAAERLAKSKTARRAKVLNAIKVMFLMRTESVDEEEMLAILVQQKRLFIDDLGRVTYSPAAASQQAKVKQAARKKPAPAKAVKVNKPLGGGGGIASLFVSNGKEVSPLEQDEWEEEEGDNRGNL
ncbi:MAG: hypothetical protein M3H12_20525 [Chromatiales bacterium]|nr:hypothetical protein [Gammaproteobacteria bacterium]